MRIEWKIDKKRGNLRPTITYTVSQDEHEKVLALPPVRIASTIPKPEQHWEEHCYPGRFERAGRGDSGELHELETPSHRGRPWPQTLRLPWRENNSYPEVEESFLMLRDAFEEALRAANASLPMQEEHSLETTDAAKAAIAPGALAERFLSLARKSARPG